MKKYSVVSKLIKAVFATCVVGSSLIGTQALAIPLKLNISRSEIIDPHTGNLMLLIDNPSQTVEMTFLKKGVSLKYKDTKGMSKEVKIHVSAMESVTHIEGNQEDVTFIFKNIDNSGLVVVSEILKDLGTNGEDATLFLNSNRPGLVHSDFSLHEVLVVNQAKSLSLINILSKSYLRIKEQQEPVIQEVLDVAPKSAAMSCSSIW